MTINFCETILAVIICSIITIVLYIASWYNQDESSNVQQQSTESSLPSDCQSTGVIKTEVTDLSRSENEVNDNFQFDDYVKIDDLNSIPGYDPVAHPDAKIGCLHLLIHYDNEQTQLNVQILDGQGLIRPEQLDAQETLLTFTFAGVNSADDVVEKHSRVIVENAPIAWKEPMRFNMTFDNVIKQNLYVCATNQTDPSAPRDREVTIPLNKLRNKDAEINEWFDLQYV